MANAQTFHSICRWTFNAGKGGFVPANVRPAWAADRFGTVEFIYLVKEKIAPRLPDTITLGVELHYDNEINEQNAEAVAKALAETGLHLAMITPGAHIHFAYGGICSLDPKERAAAEELGRRTVELAYGPLRKAWHPDPDRAPTLVIWNGSFGYDLATVGVRQMYRNLKESLARLCQLEQEKGGLMYIGIEPKPNEGHPAMLLPTVASALLIWRQLADEYGIDRSKKGVNMEIGHSEMIGLDAVYDVVEQLEERAMVHFHLNSQGYNDGIILGGPGRYDIDHGTRVNGMNIALAGLLEQDGYNRWLGHDMQPRPYDNEEQAIDRVVRSILSWEACRRAAQQLDVSELLALLARRETARAEDLMRAALVEAQRQFDALYEPTVSA